MNTHQIELNKSKFFLIRILDLENFDLFSFSLNMKFLVKCLSSCDSTLVPPKQNHHRSQAAYALVSGWMGDSLLQFFFGIK